MPALSFSTSPISPVSHPHPSTHIHPVFFAILPLFDPPCELAQIQNGCFLSSPRKSPSFSAETDIIDPTGTSIHISPQPYPSESPVPGPLNFSSASRSSSSSHSIIPTIDVTSFTTDSSQQSWLPTPPPQQPLAPNSNNNSSNNNSVLEDFVLYPAPPAPRPQPRLRDLRAPAPSNTALRRFAQRPASTQNTRRRHTLSLQLQRHLQQQFSGSPVPDPRVTQLARSSAYWSPSTHHHSAHNLSSIAPAHAGSTFEKKNQNIQFHRRNMSTPNFQGDFPLFTLHPYAMAHTLPPDTEAELLGLPSAGFTDMGLPFDFSGSQLPLGPEADTAYSPLAPPGTISPSDLMYEGSFPPSATFTDLSTPPFDSPGTFSQNPSPMFQDVDVQAEKWAPLFPDHQALPELPTPAESTKAEVQQVVTAKSPAPKPAISKSSPVSATGGAKHSTVNGISRSRKQLSPVDFDPEDPVAAKRARNTEAARKSRARKMERQQVSDARIAELERLLAQRDAEIAKLRSQLGVLSDE